MVGLKIANRRFEAIRANRLHVMKLGVLLRIDSRETIRANRRPDSRCELPGHQRKRIRAGAGPKSAPNCPFGGHLGTWLRVPTRVATPAAGCEPFLGPRAK